MIKAENPDVLIFDYDALGPNPEGIIARLRRGAPGTRILVIARASGDEDVERVLRVGAAGLVGKQLDFSALLHAIHTVAAGEIWANRRAQPGARAADQRRGGATRLRLTRREREIADGVARGLRNKEIARQLNISEKTVKSHLNNIFQKLRLDGRFALAMLDQSQIQPTNLVPFSPRLLREAERLAEKLPQ